MIAIAFRFLAGRYHATPWGHHVNEGLVEWPPSPFRILRALVAAHYKDPERLPEALVKCALGRLHGVPLYALPATTEGHTRHFMPGDGGHKTMVFDAFVATEGGAGGHARADGEGELVAVWPDADLAAEERGAIAALCRRTAYLGRAESWVEARLLADGYQGPIHARPVGDDADLGRLVRVLAVAEPAAYEAWRIGFEDGQRGQKKKVTPPADLWDVLRTDVAIMQAQGWRMPPGTRWVTYRVESAGDGSGSRGRHVAAVVAPTFARYVVDSPVLPKMATTLSVAERLRATLVKISDGAALFAGHEDDGAAMRGHRHAFYLPTDDDGDGRIDHIAVWAPGGFDRAAVSALQKVRRLWGSEGHDLHLVLVGVGRPGELARVDRGGARPSITAEGRVWESVTPYVMTRHPKLRGGVWRDTPEEQVVRACEQLLNVAPIEVQRVQARDRRDPWRGFYLERQRGSGSRASNQPHGFRLIFERAVAGPIALGYGAHFGLGLFVPSLERPAEAANFP